jgi:hypothetical protein
LSYILLWLFWRWGLMNCLPGLAWNSTLLISASQIDYRCEPPVPSLFFIFIFYFILFIFWDKVSLCSPVWPWLGTSCLNLPKYWNCRCVPLCLAILFPLFLFLLWYWDPNSGSHAC